MTDKINTDMIRTAFINYELDTGLTENRAKELFNEWLNSIIAEARYRGFDEGTSYCQRRH